MCNSPFLWDILGKKHNMQLLCDEPTGRNLHVIAFLKEEQNAITLHIILPEVLAHVTTPR